MAEGKSESDLSVHVQSKLLSIKEKLLGDDLSDEELEALKAQKDFIESLQDAPSRGVA